MVKRKTALKIRKTHRYLGLFLGVQFLFWTISGMYFSWTNIDDIHGDQFCNLDYVPKAFDDLISPSQINNPEGIGSIEIRDINNEPYYWINNQKLYSAKTGKAKKNITEEEALSVAKNYMKDGLKVDDNFTFPLTWECADLLFRLRPYQEGFTAETAASSFLLNTLRLEDFCLL